MTPKIKLTDSLKGNWPRIKKVLIDHYSAPLLNSFKQFRTGAIFFAVGLIIVYLANTSLPPSSKQELIVLLGLIMAACGFVYAMLAHIRMIISRAYRFFKS